MANSTNFEMFYALGKRYAALHRDELRRQADPESWLHAAFEWEGFQVETGFEDLPVRVYNLSRRYPDIAKERFIAGVCDALEF